MKTELGVSVAVLAALAAHGKDFDRATLNAMLEKLAASPEPKAKTGPMAMCYAMGMPESVAYDYVCKGCAKWTHYPRNYEGLKEELAFYRDGVIKLRGMGLNITLDESALCRHCVSLKSLGLPNGGEIVAKPKDEREAAKFGLRIGDKVRIREIRGDELEILPQKLEYWICEKHLDADDKVTVDDVRIRYVPLEKGDGACVVGKGTKILRLPRQGTDPKGWARIELPKCGWSAAYYVNRHVVGKYLYDEGTDAVPMRIKKLAWIINGTRTLVAREDVRILERFMNGEVYYDDGKLGPSVSMKSRLPRLRQLLGESKK